MSQPTIKWYEDERRKCINDPTFLAPDSNYQPRKREAEIASCIYKCWTCPVIKACHADAVKNPWNKGAVQGGELW